MLARTYSNRKKKKIYGFVFESLSVPCTIRETETGMVVSPQCPEVERPIYKPAKSSDGIVRHVGRIQPHVFQSRRHVHSGDAMPDRHLAGFGHLFDGLYGLSDVLSCIIVEHFTSPQQTQSNKTVFTLDTA